MARPRAAELTERELEVMHVFWEDGAATAAEVRESLSDRGRDLAYTTVATLIRILVEKNFLEQVNDERPFQFEPRKTFDEVSGRLLGEMVQKVFGGSREALLMRLLDERGLSRRERDFLQTILKERR